MAGGWSLLGLVFCVVCKMKYKDKFGSHIDVANDELGDVKEENAEMISVEEANSDEVFEEAVKAVMNNTMEDEEEKYEKP